MRLGALTVERARALVGTRFRPQGREPGTGLDCVGLVLCALKMEAAGIRRDYRLKGPHRAEVLSTLAARLRRVPARSARPGDVLVCDAGPQQVHLALDCGQSFVHADAGLGKVVETPGRPAWPVIAAFRPRQRQAR